MKPIIYLLSILLLLAGCKKDEGVGNFRDALFIDSEHTTAEGSYVQGAALNDLSKITIPYENAKGGNAKIWADERNGIRINEQTVALAEGTGAAVVTASGIPIELINTFLQINVAYQGKTYISSVEIPVMMDPDPSGVILFSVVTDPIVSFPASREIAFTVEPTMAAVVVDATLAPGMTTRIEQDFTAGTGKLILTPAAEFLSGTISLTATFGVRPVQTKTIAVNAFEGGNGTTATPYQIATAAQFMKIASGAALHYELTTDLALGAISPIATAFSGSLKGAGKSLDYTIDKPTQNHVALFAALASGAAISDLTLKGSILGQDNVAALAAANNGATLTSIDASQATVTGRNHLALLCASGTGKDAKLLSFTDTPESVNITIGTNSASKALGIAPKNASVSFDKLTTGLKSITYNTTSGEALFTMPDHANDFTPGNVTFTTKLGATGSEANVNSTPRTIAIQSKKMYESGTGEVGDPYQVKDGDQLAATMSTYPDKQIELMNNIELASWTTVPLFSGRLNGASYKISKLTKSFTASNTGVIENVKFTEVNITNTASGDFGGVANLTTGTIRKVAVVGTLTSTATGDQRFGAIAGSINGGTITDCYTNVAMVASCTGLGGIAGFFNGSGATVSFCTTEGSITWSNSATRVGGIVGRKNSNTGAADNISDCTSSMILSGTATDSGSNMIGGIFGVSSSGMNDGRLFIKRCLFSGRVKANACAGGIGGLGPDISDCIVIGEGPSATNSTVQTNTSNNGSSGGISAGAKGNITRCLVVDAKLTGPASTAGIASSQNNGAPTATGCVVVNTSVSAGGKSIYGTADTKLTLSSCFYNGVIYGDGSGVYVPSVPTNDGTSVEQTTMDQSWYEGLGYTSANGWRWDAAKSRPALNNVGCSADVKP